MLPTAVSGRAPRMSLSALPPWEPARSRSTVPATGTTAATPGKAVDSSITRAVPITSSRPTEPSQASTEVRSVGMRVNDRARSAPAANSQARVGEE